MSLTFIFTFSTPVQTQHLCKLYEAISFQLPVLSSPLTPRQRSVLPKMAPLSNVSVAELCMLQRLGAQFCFGYEFSSVLQIMLVACSYIYCVCVCGFYICFYDAVCMFYITVLFVFFICLFFSWFFIYVVCVCLHGCFDFADFPSLIQFCFLFCMGFFIV